MTRIEAFIYSVNGLSAIVFLLSKKQGRPDFERVSYIRPPYSSILPATTAISLKRNPSSLTKDIIQEISLLASSFGFLQTFILTALFSCLIIFTGYLKILRSRRLSSLTFPSNSATIGAAIFTPLSSASLFILLIVSLLRWNSLNFSFSSFS